MRVKNKVSTNIAKTDYNIVIVNGKGDGLN